MKFDFFTIVLEYMYLFPIVFNIVCFAVGFATTALFFLMYISRLSKKQKIVLAQEKFTFSESMHHKDKIIREHREENEELMCQLLKIKGEANYQKSKEALFISASEKLIFTQNLLDEKQQELVFEQKQKQTLQTENTKLRIEIESIRKNSEEKIAWLQNMQNQLTHTFRSVAADSLHSNNESFLVLAQSTLEKFHNNAQIDLDYRQQSIYKLVNPIYNSLEKVDDRISQMERDRDTIYSSLGEQIKNLMTTHHNLQNETTNLVRALRTPTVRGRWGEIQLKRVVEIAGMIEYCDFTQQQSFFSDNGVLRPDMIIKLPDNKSIVVDSKAPLLAYLESIELNDGDEKIQKLKLHAKHVRTHVNQLASKSYWEQLSPTPEFVVLFLPGENFFSAALEQDPQLIEYSAQQNIILATPTTLIALLRTVAYGWRQEKIAKHAEQISKIGKKLYQRLQIFTGHFTEMRKGLERAVDSYNKAIGSFENRILVSARKFKELGAGNADIDTLDPIDKKTRDIRFQENLDLDDDEEIDEVEVEEIDDVPDVNIEES